MDWNLNDLPIFITVADTRGMTKAARRLGIQKSSVSRAISRLEDSFNTTLMERNSRHLKLTSDGEKLYQHVQPLVQSLLHVKQQMPSQILRGSLNLATTLAFSREILSPNLASFTERYPEIRLSIRSMSNKASLLKDNFDLTIQLGDLAPSGFYAKTLVTVTLLWFCSPDYLHAHPELKQATPDTLLQHVNFYHDQENNQPELYMNGLDGIKQKVVFPHANQIDDVLMVRDLVASGNGVSLLPDIYCRQLCREGKLIQIAPEISVFPKVAISAVYASKMTQSPRLKAMIQFMEEISQEYIRQ
ncbi:LysR family transcriptional regulator [Vibrio pectenicida]|uniref:LysR family transcriptional regulator n=1 Tax=Vibrio pectenicida TaxID=62763 RepID=A0A3R9DYK7_9VIBR|nr:LysR family transcriptional regulator [Vibrio pectenicida]RSD30275.1 LysR family transcriptional regulator [Vibrio pectenicida]